MDFRKQAHIRDWVKLGVEGFPEPIPGYLHTKERPADNGMPFGSIGTGAIDLESDGTIGFVTAFNSLIPRRGPDNLPLFGISCGAESFILSTRKLANYPEDDLQRVRERRGVPAEDILYFGHYPILDAQYILDAPIAVSARFAVPFLPGSALESSVPGGLIEFTLENPTDARVSGNLVMSFPGPSAEEVCGRTDFEHRLEREGGYVLLTVKNEEGIGYCLGVNAEFAKAGGCLGVDGRAWSHIGDGRPNAGHQFRLPYAYRQSGSSLSAAYSLAPGEEKRVRFLLTWYAPVWHSGGLPTHADDGYVTDREPENVDRAYTHMYAKLFNGPEAVARHLMREGEAILRRVIAWQRELYEEKGLPDWLKDSLVNSLYCYAEDAVWGQVRPPIGDWCRAEDGLFAMNECPRGCPQLECIPCSFYGSLPLAYFFPELALSTLRGYKAYQFENGAAPWVFGGCTVGTGPWDLTTPRLGYQVTTNGVSYAAIADRLIRYSGDESLKREFYDSLKRNMRYTLDLNRGPHGVISMPDHLVSENGDHESEWFEGCEWDGVCAHVGGLHIAQLRIVERLARETGDAEFAAQCADLIANARADIEKALWDGRYYNNFHNEETGNLSDLIFGYQLDGEWIARFHGLPPVFDPDRACTALETIRENNVRHTAWGAINYVNADGSVGNTGKGGLGFNYNAYDFFPPELLMLAMTYMYFGQVEFGLELAERCWRQIVVGLNRSFNFPNLIRGDRNESSFGNDYYQLLMIWGLPAAIAGEDLETSAREDGLYKRIVRAARSTHFRTGIRGE